jgi:hypothetical protein
MSPLCTHHAPHILRRRRASTMVNIYCYFFGGQPRNSALSVIREALRRFNYNILLISINQANECPNLLPAVMRCVDEKFVTMCGSCNEAMGRPTCPASISGLPESTHAMVNGLLNLGVEAARYDLLALVAGQMILVLALLALMSPHAVAL